MDYGIFQQHLYAFFHSNTGLYDVAVY